MFFSGSMPATKFVIPSPLESSKAPQPRKPGTTGLEDALHALASPSPLFPIGLWSPCLPPAVFGSRLESLRPGLICKEERAPQQTRAEDETVAHAHGSRVRFSGLQVR